jgi:hypothetical protein
VTSDPADVAPVVVEDGEDGQDERLGQLLAMISIQRPVLFPWSAEETGDVTLTAGQRALLDVASFEDIYGRASSQRIALASRSYGFRPVFIRASNRSFLALGDYAFESGQTGAADEATAEPDSSTVVAESMLAKLEDGLAFVEWLWMGVQTDAFAQIASSVTVGDAAGGE